MNPKETFLESIYEQFENGEWMDIEEQLDKTVDDLISSSIDQETFCSRMAELNFPSNKMDPIMKLFNDLFQQNLLSFEMFGEHREQYPGTCKKLQLFMADIKPENQKQFIQNIFKLLLSAQDRKLELFLKQKKFPVPQIEELKNTFKEESKLASNFEDLSEISAILTNSLEDQSKDHSQTFDASLNILNSASEKDLVIEKMKKEFEQRLAEEKIKSQKDTQDLIEKMQKEQSQKQAEEQLLKEKEILKLKEEVEMKKAETKQEEEKKSQRDEEIRLMNSLSLRNISKKKTIIYQKEDQSLSQTSIKMFCNSENVKILLQEVKENKIKCIGFFGDFATSIKILQNMYPSAQEELNFKIEEPSYDQLISFSDGQNLFFLYENSRDSFQGDIYENDDGIILIRFLLDACGIVVMCLGDIAVQNWTDKILNDFFSVSTPPKIIKDRSTIVIKEISTISNISKKQDCQLLLFQDDSNIFATWKSSQEYIFDVFSNTELKLKLSANKEYITSFINDVNFHYQKDKTLNSLLKNKQNIENIFLKSTDIQQEISILYFNLQQQILNLINEINNEYSRILHGKENSIDSNILEDSEQMKEIFSNETKKIKMVKSYMTSIEEEYLNARQVTLFGKNLYEKNSKYKGYTLNRLIQFFKSSEFVDIKKNDLKSLLCNDFVWQFFNKYWKQYCLKWGNNKVQLSKIPLLKQEIENFCITNTIQSIELYVDYSQNKMREIVELGSNFCNQIDQYFIQYQNQKIEQIILDCYSCNYDSGRDSNFVSPLVNNSNIPAPSSAHSILGYINFDDNVDYVASLNSKDPVNMQALTFWIIQKKGSGKNKYSFKSVYHITGRDFCFFINRHSKQWVVFENTRRIGQIGKINSDYTFQEGSFRTDIFQTQIGSTQEFIERIDSCFILNSIETTVFLQDKSKEMFYSFSLQGKLSIKEFNITQEIDSKLVDQKLKVLSFCNNIDNDIYVFETTDSLIITNPNYITKASIPIVRENFKGFKLIETDWNLLLIVITLDLTAKTYVISEQEDSLNNTSIISSKDLAPVPKGNIVIDKFLKAIQQYGRNFVEMKCPASNYILTYFDDSSKPPADIHEKIFSYIDRSYDSMSLNYKLMINQTYITSKINEISGKIISVMNQIDPILKEDLALIILSRIPIQISTIQQSIYIPLKDGIYSPEILEIKGVENQVDYLKNNFSFGWYEDIFNMKIENLSIVSMCGRQSIGKSSQQNRMFGTRFGVSAARCTDGVWLGFSKIGERCVIVLDCEGLFSTRRTTEEELKLLQQVILISTVSMVFQDLEGINKPLLDLFNKLQSCVGKKKGEGIYFLGTLLLLTKNIADEGDKLKIEKETAAYLSQKSISGMMSSLFKGGISYGYMKPFLAKDFDSKLKQLRNELILGHIIDKRTVIHPPKKLQTYLKYSIAQLFLDDDEDVEIISLYDTIQTTTEKFKEIYNNLNSFEFPDSIFQINFTYQENESQDSTSKPDILPEKLKENSEEGQKVNDNTLFQRQLTINQKEIIFSDDTQNADIFDDQNNSQSKKQIFQVFNQQYQSQMRLNHNTYYQQFQRFAFMILEQRKQVVLKYFCGSLPKELKFLELCQKHQRILETFIENIRQDNCICLKKCQICDRACIMKADHKGDCSCETTHQCLSLCELCKKGEDFYCSKISGHKGDHMCLEQKHKCGKKCEISIKCTSLCTYDHDHDSSIKHSCQEEHKCSSQCRLFAKCKKTCSLVANHEEDYHQCDSKKCFDKCSLCDKDCNVPMHNHDILLENIELNRNLLKVQVKNSLKQDIMIDALAHLCGDTHNCNKKCQKPGVCKIIYNTEVRNWFNFFTQDEVPFTYLMPVQSQKECILKIEGWKSTHSEQHSCKENHRCDVQCPECKAFCSKDYGHGGNHYTKSHRNKEKCIVVNQKENAQVKIEEEGKSTKEYKVGQSPAPETCSSSCSRQGRAHRHLQVCQGGSQCAENTTPFFAKHVHDVLYPHTELKYDLVYCKQYWNSIGWDSPLFESNENEMQLCNWACSHESHSVAKGNMNYCNKKAGHEDEHFIDTKLCTHPCQSSDIDVCFTIDTTGSMGWVFPEVKKSIEKIIVLFKKASSHLRFAVVAYKDHPPEDTNYVYKIVCNLETEEQVIKAVTPLTANGGGDTPEAVMDGLFYSCKSISWREGSQRFIFHIGDAPPHGKEYGCSSSNSQWSEKGCPCGTKKEDIARELANNNIFYYLLLCNSSLNMMKSQFESVFGKNFKQSIDIKNTSDINILIAQELIKECKYNPELYHVLKD